MNWETFAHEADVGVRGSGATLAEAFAGAATAMTAAICDPAKVGHPLSQSLSRKGRGKLSASSLPLRERGRERGIGDAVIVACTAPDEEMLLVDWLNALIYEMATRHMLFSCFEVSIEDRRAAGGGSLHLQAIVRGEHVDVAKHQPAAEVKGASFCELAVRREPDGRWLAQCVVDA